MAANLETMAIRIIWAMQNINAAVMLMNFEPIFFQAFSDEKEISPELAFKAETGRSISMSCKSWLNRLRVVPVSVAEKKDIGAL